MTRVNIAEAKARLSELIEAELQGEDRVIARRNTPVAKLTAGTRRPTAPRFGVFKGGIRISDDFEAPLESFAEYTPPARSRRQR
jgi:antitoxin (DNA-binding transcriptional repressor) of toxin-antitoxin stability system